jgi:hypothetical protein
MTRTEPLWLTPQLYTRLQNELAALRALRRIEIPADTGRLVTLLKAVPYRRLDRLAG